MSQKVKVKVKNLKHFEHKISSKEFIDLLSKNDFKESDDIYITFYMLSKNELVIFFSYYPDVKNLFMQFPSQHVTVQVFEKTHKEFFDGIVNCFFS